MKDSYNENYKERKKDITEDTDQGKDTLQFTQLYYLKPVSLPQNSPDHAVHKDLFLLERACSSLSCTVSSVRAVIVWSLVPPSACLRPPPPPCPARAGFSIHSVSLVLHPAAPTHHWGFWMHLQKGPEEIKLAKQRAPAVATLRETSLSDPRSRNANQEAAPPPGWDAVYIFFF